MKNYKEITCKSACNKIKTNRLPYKWDLNIYRGCEHGCKYCFALYSHNYMNSNQFFDDVYVKINIVEKLEEQLKKSSWKKEVINIGGVTDSYQRAEQKYKLMPEILKLMIKYKNPCIISTKSDLILRDFDLIDELSRITYINVAATITAVDENIRRKIEPNGVSTRRRFRMLKEFSKTNASIGVHAMPIIPYITDTRENIEALYQGARDCNATYLLAQILNLRGITKCNFLNFLKCEYPYIYPKMEMLYKSGRVDTNYSRNLYSMIAEIRAKYGVSNDYTNYMNKILNKDKSEQLSFF